MIELANLGDGEVVVELSIRTGAADDAATMRGLGVIVIDEQGLLTSESF